jgi:formyltetrahydrofolate-dependent phosphoribosylglycinamide formyltransferase
MFERLQKKWQLTGVQLLLVLTTFAVGGSLTGFLGRKLMDLIPVQQNWLWVTIYIIVVTLLWPLSVLSVSILFGQYRFFTGYLKKMGRRIGLLSKEKELEDKPGLTNKRDKPARLAIFASGKGSNAQMIIEHFRYSSKARIVLIVCNKPDAGVISIAEKENIPVLLLQRDKFLQGDGYLDEIRSYDIDLIILAGLLWKLPTSLVHTYSSRILNIHPALLPKYGGKGMYGDYVHKAVLKSGDKESGISIHLVDEIYDHGKVIFQAHCPVLQSDTPESLAERIHKLEHAHYPKIIERVVEEKFGV